LSPGNNQWTGGIGGHGNKYLRCLLVEGAQAILRCSRTPLALWGKRFLARKGQINLVVAAMARKLTVAAWYLMMGRWTPLEEIDDRLCVKVGKIIGQVGAEALKRSGKNSKILRQEVYEALKAAPRTKLPEATVYVLGPEATPSPQEKNRRHLIVTQARALARATSL